MHVRPTILRFARTLLRRPPDGPFSEIERVITDIVKRLPRTYGDDLSGFAISWEHDLWDQGGLEEDTIDMTVSSMLESLVEVSGDVASSVNSLQELGSGLGKVWRFAGGDAVPSRYGGFQASTIHSYKEATIMRFVTVWSYRPQFITGTVRVAGANYSRLVEDYERLPGPATERILPRLTSTPD